MSKTQDKIQNTTETLGEHSPIKLPAFRVSQLDLDMMIFIPTIVLTNFSVLCFGNLGYFLISCSTVWYLWAIVFNSCHSQWICIQTSKKWHVLRSDYGNFF